MGEQPTTREFVMQQIAQLPPDSLAEVARFIEFLQFKAQSAFKMPLPHRGEHPAFGLWADRSDIQDPIRFTQNCAAESRNGEMDNYAHLIETSILVDFLNDKHFSPLPGLQVVRPY